MTDKIPGLFYHQEVSAPIRIAGVLGITGAAFLAGQSAAVSYLFAPAALEAPAPLLAKQWKKVYERGLPTGIGFLAVAGIFGGLAAYEKPSSSTFKYYIISAVSILSTIPYTFAVMGGVNGKLQKKSEDLASASLSDTAAEAGVSKEETTHALVDQWATLNLGRAALAAVSAVVALWATTDSVEYVGMEGIRLASGANRMG